MRPQFVRHVPITNRELATALRFIANIHVAAGDDGFHAVKGAWPRVDQERDYDRSWLTVKQWLREQMGG